MLISKRNLLGTLVSLTIIGFLFASSSLLLADPVPGGPGYAIYHASAFLPTKSTITYNNFNSRLVNETAPFALFYAPVSLPHGATINKFILYYTDNDATQNTNAELRQTAYPDLTSPILASVSSDGSSPTPTFAETTGITNPVIDNQRYGYHVRLFLPVSVTNLSVNGFRIDYTFPINLPLIMK